MLTKDKRDYLIKLIGFHLEDLTPALQVKFKSYPAEFDWKLAALSEGTLKDWNEWGFRLWSNFDFVQRVDAKLKAIEEMSDEEVNPKPQVTKAFDTFGQRKTIDVKKLATYPTKVWFWVNDTTIKSKITNQFFDVVGGKETYDKFIAGELGKVPECEYVWNKKENRYDSLRSQTTPQPVLSIEWHRLTSWQYIDEVEKYAPGVYEIWSSTGLIPKDLVVKKDRWELE